MMGLEALSPLPDPDLRIDGGLRKSCRLRRARAVAATTDIGNIAGVGSGYAPFVRSVAVGRCCEPAVAAGASGSSGAVIRVV